VVEEAPAEILIFPLENSLFFAYIPALSMPEHLSPFAEIQSAPITLLHKSDDHYATRMLECALIENNCPTEPELREMLQQSVACPSGIDTKEPGYTQMLRCFFTLRDTRDHLLKLCHKRQGYKPLQMETLSPAVQRLLSDDKGFEGHARIVHILARSFRGEMVRRFLLEGPWLGNPFEDDEG